MVYRVEANNWDGSGQFQLNTENLSDILALVLKEPRRQCYALLYDERARLGESYDWQSKCALNCGYNSKDEFINDLEHLISIGF